jgi:hypothetical protein
LPKPNQTRCTSVKITQNAKTVLPIRSTVSSTCWSKACFVTA